MLCHHLNKIKYHCLKKTECKLQALSLSEVVFHVHKHIHTNQSSNPLRFVEGITKIHYAALWHSG